MKPILVSLTFFISSFALAQTELSLKKFRLRPGTPGSFERLVLEFKGTPVDTEAEVKKTSSGTEQDISIRISNVQWMGAIPESQINEQLENKRKFMGPLVINTDSPKNGFTLRTLLKNPEYEVDAFWLSKPTRLVVDVFSKSSPRMDNRAFNPAATMRKVSSVKMKKSVKKSMEPPMPEAKVSPVTAPVPVPVPAPALSIAPKPAEVASSPMNSMTENKEKEVSENIFCFLSKAQMSPTVAYEPWRGGSSIPLEVRNPSAAEGEQKEGIVCYPALSRVHPQLNFDKAENINQQAAGVEPRNPASEAKPKTFNPTTSDKDAVPPSLGANFEKAVKRANPAILLPPYQ